MGDNIEFQTEDYAGNGDLEGQEAIDGQQSMADGAYLSGDPCTNGDCQNTHNPAEDAWVKLVSAIPVAGQISNLKCVATGTAAPSQDEVQSLVAQVRPADPDKYALKEIALKWGLFNNDFADNEGTAVAPILRSKLTELSNGWQGNDFDAFAEQMEAVFTNCEQIAADIGTESTGMVGLLNQKGDEIYNLQGGGSGELPYPAPQYWVEDEGSLFTDTKIHVRPPFHSGECEISDGCAFDGEDDGVKGAMEMGGFDGEYTNELNQYVVDQTEYHYTRLKAEHVNGVDTKGMDAEEKAEATTLTASQESSLRAEAERLAQQDANERAQQDYSEGSQDYEARATEQNDSVTARWQDAETSTSEFVPTVQPSGDTTFRDSAGDLSGSGYSPPGGGDFNGMPSGSGTAGLTPPSNTSTFGPGGNLTGGSNPGSTGGLNPWESTGGGDDDDISGGLASGGGLGAGAGTLTGAGLGTGGGGMGAGGGSLGPGSGLFGPASGGAGSMTGMTGAGSGRGAGAGGMGKGQGLFGKTAGAGAGGKAGAGGMMGGGRGAGATGDNEDADTGTWLTEDEDVWGLARFNDENDPLA
ncbi:hypothetical protein [Glycomyces algeriensis]|uniref:Uncharacterized protein n=1 Tax=Glycomyces algeriensis TaxID=256037 RepID=A0A9W6GBE0_9ACTN|nr:hypothetical protein [Glycomyces algeriensis]MDA1366536.1 hypothetical protein [Glycomyces algeriensis]MDR7352194.1 hypothetical protein [Glycomyces algeriensis]GLI44929.1 hypothetical protein GALLR39Z86_47790 [Glycomyces algeriensis]